MNISKVPVSLNGRPQDLPAGSPRESIKAPQVNPAILKPFELKSAAFAMAKVMRLAQEQPLDVESRRELKRQLFMTRPVTSANQPADVRELIKRGARLYDVLETENIEEISVATNEFRIHVINMLRFSNSLPDNIASTRGEAILFFLREVN